MRKAGILDDAEQITNPNFRSHQPASRALVSQMSIKTLAADNKPLKYNDRVPTRKSVGGLAEENLKDPQARDMARAQLVTSDMGARVVQEMAMAVDYQAQFGSKSTLPKAGLSTSNPNPFASMAAGSAAPQRDRRRDGQTLGQGPEEGPTAFNYDPSKAEIPAAMEVFVAAAGGMQQPGPLTNAIANGALGKAQSGKALGANRGQGGGRGPSNRPKVTKFDKAVAKAEAEVGMDTSGVGNTATKVKGEGGGGMGKKAKIEPIIGYPGVKVEDGSAANFGRIIANEQKRGERKAARKPALKKAKEDK